MFVSPATKSEMKDTQDAQTAKAKAIESEKEGKVVINKKLIVGLIILVVVLLAIIIPISVIGSSSDADNKLSS